MYDSFSAGSVYVGRALLALGAIVALAVLVQAL
jgi:hypothetical protein